MQTNSNRIGICYLRIEFLVVLITNSVTGAYNVGAEYLNNMQTLQTPERVSS